jgi:hypothetical protein
MSTRHDNADGPEDIDAAFAEIVAGLERDAPMSRWPEDHRHPDDDPGASAAPTPAVQPAPEPDGPRDWSLPADPEEDEGHFEPPEPPPLPKPKPATVGGAALVGLGLLLLLIPGLLSQDATVALPLGLVAISAGISWLLFRMRQGPPDSGDGAQL